MSLTKFGKKLLCFLAFFALVFAFVSCTPTETEASKAKEEAITAVENAATKILWDKSAMMDITNDLVLHTNVGDVKVEWASTHPDVISTSGKVLLPGGNHEDATLIDSEDESKGKHVPVTLTATFSKEYSYLENGEEVKNVVRFVQEYKFTVLCFTGVKGTIAEMKAAAWNYIYEEQGVNKELVSNPDVVFLAGVTGVVTTKLFADGAGQFMIHDGTEGIYVYNNANVNVGDVVEITGNIYSYYGNLQFGSSIKVTVLEGQEMAKPEYKNISVQEWEDSVKDLQKIGYHGGELYAIEAILEKVDTPNVAKDEYRLVDPFTAEVAWIYYKSYNAEMQAKLDEYVGKFVRITGVTYDRDSRLLKNHLMWDGGIEEAKAPELSDEQKMVQVKAKLAELAGSYVGGVKLALPTEYADFGATVAWELPEGAPYADGKFALVSEETSFVAKATVTIGSVVETVEVAITVKPIETVSVNQVAKLEKGSVVKLAGTVEAVFASKGYFYLRDLTGTILVYVQTSNGITVNGETVTLKAGDKVSFTGETNVFNGCPQIGSVMSYDSYVAGEWKQATAKATTVAEILSFKLENAPYGEYLYAKGVIVADAEGKYFYLAESTAEGAGKISLYNSSLPEEVKALAGTDTEVTLYFYFYGFQKTDYSGDTRVVYVGREGEHTFGEVEVPVKPEDGKITIAEAIEIAMKQEHNTYTTEKYTITGTINDLYNTVYGNMHLLDAQGNDITIYGLYIEGQKYGDYAGTKPVEGETITVKGILGTYNGKPQMKNAELVVEKPEHVHTACPTCGLCNDPKCDGAADVKCTCGQAQPGEGTVVEVVIKDYADANGWANGTMYNELVMDSNVTVTMVATGGSGTYAPNTGKYYTSGNEWRCYQSDKEATIVIAVKEGLTISYVKVTYNINKDGILLNGSAQVASGAVVEVNASSITFSVGNTGTGTTGQVKVTAIEVGYGKDGSTPELPKHEHVACPTCGLCTAADCDGAADAKCQGHTVTPPTDGKITIAEAIEIANKQAHNTYTTEKYTITGTINDLYNTVYGNMHLLDAQGNDITIYGLYIEGQKYGDYAGTKPVEGETITVKGILGTYNGKPQMKNAELVVETAPKHEHTACPTCGLCTAADCDGEASVKCQGHEVTPPADGTITLAEAIEIANKQAHNTYTTEKYTVTGTVNDLYNTQYGNMHLLDAQGNDLTIYGLYQNGTRYDGLTVKPVEGNVITVTGILGTYNGKPQMKNAELVKIEGVEEPKHEHVACPTCGLCTDAKCDGADAEKCQGHVVAPVEGTVITTVIKDYADANGWASGTMYNELVMDSNVTVTMAATGGSGSYAPNTGKYYTSGYEWRCYQSDQEATIVIAVAEGYVIKTVKVTYNINKDGILLNGSTQVASGTVVEVNGSSITFSVGNTGTATNGQVKVTAIEVVYDSNAPVIPTHEHVACPTCGLCTAEDCTGTAEEKCAGHAAADPVTVTWDWTKGSGTISSDSKTLTVDCGDFIITLYQNTSTSKPVNTYDQLRFYQGHILTITGKNGKVVTGFTFNDIAGKGASTVTFHGDNASLYTYTVSGKDFIIASETGAESIGIESNKQIRFTSITVTLK